MSAHKEKNTVMTLTKENTE